MSKKHTLQEVKDFVNHNHPGSAVLSFEYINCNKIDFEWQPKTFESPGSSSYRPDLFIINENKWIEIKGYMRPKPKIKWSWFKTQFPTAELWDRPKLKEIGIL